jgi:large subunit ribosomal protein L15
MKLHDLRPATGSRTPRTRVGRGIAAGGGKTAGRGTKGQKARAGASIPPWFEGGQTPLHQRIPKLRGFRNPFKVEYEVVNLGRIAALVELGALELGEPAGTAGTKAGKATSTAPITVNQEILRAVGLVRTLDKPMKVLGHGEIDRALFVVADAFSKSAVSKIEAAGGSVQVLQIPTGPLAALGIEPPAEARPDTHEAETEAPSAAEPTAKSAAAEAAAEPSAEASEAPSAEPAAAPPGASSAQPAPSATAASAPSRKPARASAGRSTTAAEPGTPATAKSGTPATAKRGTPAASKPDTSATAKPAARAARPARRQAGARPAATTDPASEPAPSPAAEDDSPEAPAGTDA